MIRLLHIDDDQDIHSIAQLALEISGDFELFQCGSGAEAKLAVERFWPEILLLDVMMPGLTGPLTLRKIREIPGFENVPAIFLTARVSFDENEELWDLGTLDVITKPFDPVTLGQQIKSAIEGKPK